MSDSKFKIYNNIEEKIIFKGDSYELLEFTEIIKQENEDEFVILSVSDAIEYIENYCCNLYLIIQK